MDTKGAETKKGSATVVLLDDNIIVCRLQGVATGPIVAKAMEQTRLLVDSVQVHGQASLLLDASKVTRPTSEARTKAKELQHFGFERIAVINGNRMVTMLGHYIVRIAGMSGYTKFFDKEKQAVAWLKKGSVKTQDTLLMKRSLVALLVAILATATLIGWQLDVPALRSIVPTFKPMNPATAIILLLMALAVVTMSGSWAANKIRRRFIYAVGLVSMVLGLAVLLRYALPVDAHLDNRLFGSRIPFSSARISLSGGISMLSLGGMFWLLASGQRSRWQRVLFCVCNTIVFVQSMFIIVAAAFGFESLYRTGAWYPMPLNTAVAFLLLNDVLTVMSRPVAASIKAIRIVYNYWQAIAVTLILVLATGVAWHVARQDVTASIANSSNDIYGRVQSAVSSRFAAYIDALNGYKGLFAASSDVAPGEFHNFFVNTGLATNYPGFTAITYASAVPDGNKQAFINQTRARANSTYPRYKDFTIFPQSNSAVHYPLTYVEPGRGTTTFGFDLSSEKVRLATLEKARDSGEAAASGIIDLNASRKNAAKNYGFFLSQPIYATDNTTLLKTTAQRQAALSGFVIAYFQNDRLFNDLLASTQDDNARFTISDAQTGKQIYSSTAKHVSQDTPLRQTTTLAIAGKTWRLSMSTTPDYGKSNLYKVLPAAILIGGLSVAGLAGSLVLAQLRRRDQALQLAANMTEDLNTERNTAVATQQKDEAILSSIGDAVFAIDTQERITLFNQACVRISGYTADEAVGKPYTEILQFIFERNGKINNGFIKQALLGHVTSMKNHTILVRKDGKHVAVADSAAPIRNASNTLLGAIVVFRDVSKEQELDRAKTEFVSLASHQLRTPLSAINWYGELLLNGDAGKLSADQNEYVREIYEGNQRMIDLVNSLLDVSRLDLGKLMNQPAPTDMRALAASLQKELQTTIDSKRLHYVAQIQSSLPKVFADPKLLRMIVQNYFSNAVKYTPNDGSVHLALREATEAELEQAKLSTRHEHLFFSVSDTGYGIPKAQQAKIFSKLFRADNVRALDVEGTGLGLYIVKEVVEKFGGRVWFTSTEGAGSTFYAIFPFKTKADIPPKTEKK
jgi:PAS domain S-box-containing protein